MQIQVCTDGILDGILDEMQKGEVDGGDDVFTFPKPKGVIRTILLMPYTKKRHYPENMDR